MSYSPCNCDDLECRECGAHNREKMVVRVRGMAAFIASKWSTIDWFTTHSKPDPSRVTAENAQETERQLKRVGLELAEIVYNDECEAARKEAIERTLRKQCAWFAESMT